VDAAYLLNVRHFGRDKINVQYYYEGMEQLTMTETVKKLLTNITVHFFVILICGLLINAAIKFDTQAAYITGLSLGAAVSAAQVFLIEQSIDKSLSMKTVSAGMYAVLQITLRNLLTAGVMVCAVFVKGISVWGVIAGLFILQSAAFALKRKGA